MGKPGGRKKHVAQASEDQFYNILFLGQTGVGKSTFINAFVNYLRSDSLSKAKETSPLVLISSKFVLTNDNLEEKVIVTDSVIAGPENESKVLGDSATQEARPYVFPLLGVKKSLRLIDTPGIGDTRGIDQDNINCDNILKAISLYEELHAICILLKPNNARITAQFEFCIKQLLSRLEKSAAENIIFIFTNSRSTFYRPGDTLPALKKLLEGIKEQPPHVEIPLTPKNIYCMDNEPFRFLIAMKEVKFTPAEEAQFERSWEVSRKVCLEMLKYIMGDDNNPGLKPHLTRETVSINEVRRVIIQLAQPLADISQLIYDNMYGLEQQVNKLSRTNQSLDELKKNLYVPVVDLKETRFDQPRTVCTALKCCSTYTVQGKTKYHYSQRCHNPCYLQNVPQEILGPPQLFHCAAMNSSGRCNVCSCDYQAHMHIYYETEVFETKQIDDNVNLEITNKAQAVAQAQKFVDKLKLQKREYEAEHQFILKATARFATFLKNNAITPYNDAYKTYIAYLIDREKSLGERADSDVIQHLQMTMIEYEKYKTILDQAMSSCTTQQNIANIQDTFMKLYGLKHMGRKIKTLYTCQEVGYQTECYENEYIYESGLDISSAQESDSSEQEPDSQKKNTTSSRRGGKKNNNRQQQNWKGQQNKPWQGQQRNQQWQGPRNQQWRGPPPNRQWRGPPNQQWQGPPPNQQWSGPPPGQQWRGPPPGPQWRGPPPSQQWTGPPPNQQWYGPPPNQGWQGPPPPWYQDWQGGQSWQQGPGGPNEQWQQQGFGTHEWQMRGPPPPPYPEDERQGVDQENRRYSRKYSDSGEGTAKRKQSLPSTEQNASIPIAVGEEALEKKYSQLNLKECNSTDLPTRKKNPQKARSIDEQLHNVQGKKPFKKHQRNTGGVQNKWNENCSTSAASRNKDVSEKSEGESDSRSIPSLLDWNPTHRIQKDGEDEMKQQSANTTLRRSYSSTSYRNQKVSGDDETSQQSAKPVARPRMRRAIAANNEDAKESSRDSGAYGSSASTRYQYEELAAAANEVEVSVAKGEPFVMLRTTERAEKKKSPCNVQ